MYGNPFNGYGEDGGRKLSEGRLERLIEKATARAGMWALSKTLPTRGDGPVKRELRESARQLLGSTDGLSDARGRAELSAFDDHRHADRPLPPRLRVALGVGGVLAAASLVAIGSEAVRDIRDMLPSATVQDTRSVEDFLPTNPAELRQQLDGPSDIDWLIQPLINAAG